MSFSSAMSTAAKASRQGAVSDTRRGEGRAHACKSSCGKVEEGGEGGCQYVNHSGRADTV